MIFGYVDFDYLHFLSLFYFVSPPLPYFPSQHKSCLVFFCKIPFLFDILLLYTIQNVSVWRKIVYSKGTVSWESCVHFVVASTYKSRSYLSALRKRNKGRWVSWQAGCQWDLSERAPQRDFPLRHPATKEPREQPPKGTHSERHPNGTLRRAPWGHTSRALRQDAQTGALDANRVLQGMNLPLDAAYKFSWYPTFNCNRS